MVSWLPVTCSLYYISPASHAFGAGYCSLSSADYCYLPSFLSSVACRQPAPCFQRVGLCGAWACWNGLDGFPSALLVKGCASVPGLWSPGPGSGPVLPCLCISLVLWVAGISSTLGSVAMLPCHGAWRDPSPVPCRDAGHVIPKPSWKPPVKGTSQLGQAALLIVLLWELGTFP